MRGKYDTLKGPQKAKTMDNSRQAIEQQKLPPQRGHAAVSTYQKLSSCSAAAGSFVVLERKSRLLWYASIIATATLAVQNGVYSRNNKKGAKKLSEIQHPSQGRYNPDPVTEENWRDSEGVNCPICGQKTLQLFPYGFARHRQACKECIERRIKLLEYRARVASPRFR